MSRFEGCRALYKDARSGGVGSFTADNFPVFDYLKPNVYAILDSNHGYKMIGVGREVAKVVLGEPLEPPLPVPLRALRDRRPPPGHRTRPIPGVEAWDRSRARPRMRFAPRRSRRTIASGRTDAFATG